MLLYAVTAFASQLCTCFYSDTPTKRGLRINSVNCVSFPYSCESQDHSQSSVFLVLVPGVDCLGLSGLGLNFNLSCKAFLAGLGLIPTLGFPDMGIAFLSCLSDLRRCLASLVLLLLAFQDLFLVS